MPYVFQGRLCGYICANCPEPLFPAVVRLYRPDLDRIPPRAKEAFAILSDDDRNGKADRLLAEVETDAEGRFAVDFGDDSNYDGGPFELDVYLERAPGQDAAPRGAEPVQATVAVVHPEWEQRDNDYRFRFDYCLAARLWCLLRARFDAWVICGRVLNVTDGSPVGGLTVEAYDADWLQDDTLGSAVTDGSGRFRIDYTSAAFKRTPFSPFLNVELTGGPDVYFKVRDGGGTLLIDEQQSAGRQPGRENVGRCFCVTLRVQVGDGNTPPVDDPLFTHIGDFSIVSDIDPATGLTNKAAFQGTSSAHGGPDFGFHSVMKLKGFAPAALASNPGADVFYRFVYVDPASPGTEVPVTGGLVAPTPIGSRWIPWDQDNDGFAEWRPQSMQIRSSGATPGLPTPNPGNPPPLHIIEPDADGWIQVDAAASGGGFGDLLMRLNSAAAVPGGTPPNDGPGNAVSAANQRNGTKVTLKFQVATSPGGAPLFEDTVDVYLNNWAEVRLLELVKTTAGGGTTTDPCAPTTGSIDARYTVDHELLRSWSLGLSANNGWTASGPSGPTAASPRGDAGTHTFPLGPGVGGPEHCSHTVSLTSQRRLTDGELDDDGDTTHDTFCT